MMAKVRILFALVVVCVLLINGTRQAQAQVFVTHDAAKLVGITVGLTAIGAGIGIGAYAAIHRNHRLTGCALNSANGLELQASSDRQIYALIGEVSAVKAGDRVRVSGKKSKGNGDVKPQFLVERLEKDFGACPFERSRE